MKKLYEVKQYTEAEYDAKFEAEYESGEFSNEEDVINVVWKKKAVCMDVTANGKRIVPILRKVEKAMQAAGLSGEGKIYDGWFGTWADSLTDSFDKKHFIWSYDGRSDIERGFWSYSWSIEQIDEDRWYIFLNLSRAIYDEQPQQEEQEEQEEQPKESKEEKKMNTTEKIIVWFEENEDVFNDCMEELDAYNGYLGDDRYYLMEELDELCSGTDASEILRRAFYGHDEDTYNTDAHGEREYGPFNPNRNYFRYNGYGNLVSSDYKDYTEQRDKWAIESMQENRQYINTIDCNKELSELFDELEEEDN